MTNTPLFAWARRGEEEKNVEGDYVVAFVGLMV
jgi:hypothetical protein